MATSNRGRGETEGGCGAFDLPHLVVCNVNVAVVVDEKEGSLRVAFARRRGGKQRRLRLQPGGRGGGGWLTLR